MRSTIRQAVTPACAPPVNRLCSPRSADHVDPQTTRNPAEQVEMQPTLDPEVIKKTFKDALVEVLHEERDVLREVLAEVVEDSALAGAVRQGQDSELVDRDEVFRILEGKR